MTDSSDASDRDRHPPNPPTPPNARREGLRWRDMTLAEREREYSPSSCLPRGDYRPFVADYRRRSDDAWSRVGRIGRVRTATIPYGNAPSQTIDLAVPTDGDPTPPLLAYFHGGYWQELSKLDSRFAVSDCIERGWAFAAVDYTLAPAADLPAIVEECRQSLRALVQHAASLGFDPDRTFVAGSSAGAHLAAMVAADPDPATPSARGAILVSGIFELEPLIDTSIDEALALDVATAAEQSPLRTALDDFPPSILAYGANETAEFKAQSGVFAEQLRRAGRAATVLEIPGRNHFDVILDLATPHTLLGDAVADLIDTQRNSHADV